MGAAGRRIHGLKDKALVIAGCLAETGKIKIGSIKSLATFCDIPPSTLHDAVGYGRLTQSIEAKLAAKGGFSVDDPAWADPSLTETERGVFRPESYRGRDTVDAFRKTLRAAHQLNPSVDTRVMTQGTQSLDLNLLSYEFDDGGQTTLLGESIRLFFSMTFAPGRPHQDVTFRFRNVRVRILRDDETVLTFVKRLGDDGPFRIRDAVLTVRNKTLFPVWSLTAPAGALDDEYATQEPLCEIDPLPLNTSFRAEVAVNLHDPQSLEVVTSRDVKEETAKVLEALFLQSLSGTADTQGWKTLGIQRMKLVRA